MSVWTDAAWNEANERPRSIKFVEKTTQIAAVPHTCSICGGTIAPGQRYERMVSMAIGEDAPHVLKEHAPFCDIEDPSPEGHQIGEGAVHPSFDAL